MSEAIQQRIQILPIAEEHIESYHQCLDSVARERMYLALVEAPPLDSTRAFVLSNTEQWIQISSCSVFSTFSI